MPSSIFLKLFLTALLYFISSVAAYCPVVICPGFGNDSIDYKEPLNQPSSIGFISVLSRRGFDTDQIYTVPIKRSDWIKVAGGLLEIDFYRNNAKPDGKGYGWYIQRLKETVDLAYEESGGEKVMLVGHSAGGWLARAALGDGIWSGSDGDAGSQVNVNERVRGLVTLGAIHRGGRQIR